LLNTVIETKTATTKMAAKMAAIETATGAKGKQRKLPAIPN